jgi:chromosome segregation ATPase
MAFPGGFGHLDGGSVVHASSVTPRRLGRSPQAIVGKLIVGKLTMGKLTMGLLSLSSFLLLGCQAANVVERGEAEAEANQAGFYQAELEEVAVTRERKLRQYESLVARQERQYEGVVEENRQVKVKLKVEKVELASASIDLKKVSGERAAVAANVGKERAQVAALTKERATLASQHKAQQVALVALRKETETLRNRVGAGTTELAALRKQSSGLQEQLASARGELGALSAQKGALAQEVALLDAHHKQLLVSKQTSEDTLAKLRAARTLQMQEVAKLEESRATTRLDIQKGHTDLARLEQKQVSLKERSVSARKQQHTLQVDLARVQVSVKQSKNALARNRGQEKKSKAALDHARALQKRVALVTTEIASLEKELIQLGTSKEWLQKTREAVKSSNLVRLRKTAKVVKPGLRSPAPK